MVEPPDWGPWVDSPDPLHGHTNVWLRSPEVLWYTTNCVGDFWTPPHTTYSLTDGPIHIHFPLCLTYQHIRGTVQLPTPHIRFSPPVKGFTPSLVITREQRPCHVPNQNVTYVIREYIQKSTHGLSSRPLTQRFPTRIIRDTRLFFRDSPAPFCLFHPLPCSFFQHLYTMGDGQKI